MATNNALNNRSSPFTVTSGDLTVTSGDVLVTAGDLNITTGDAILQNGDIDVQQGSVTIDPGASGDAFIQFNINTTGEFRIGVDDDASDAFKISQGSALGTNDTFIMTADGIRTLPLNSAFSAYNSSAILNVAGTTATNYTVPFDTTIYDQNSDLTSTTTFTAPVTGRYLIIANVTFGAISAAMTQHLNALVSSNRTYINTCSPAACKSSTGSLTFTASSYVDMDSGDTVTYRANIRNGAADDADLLGSADLVTWWGGCLVS